MDANLLTLPPGWRTRPPRPDDLQAVTTLLNELDIADRGKPDTDAEDIAADWRRTGFDLAEDALLLVDPEGQPAGYTDVHLQEHWAMLDPGMGVLPQYGNLGLQQTLLEWAERRGVQQALAAGRSSPLTLRTVSTRSGHEQLYQSNGYQAVRWDHRMGIELDTPPSEPAWPEGFRVRTLQPGEEDQRTLHRVIYSAFADLDHIGSPSFEDWRVWMFERADYDPTLTYLVERGGEVVGCAICFDYPDTGWVRQLAVLREYRRLGLGEALLRQAFAELYRRGKREVGLVVDTLNPTGAPKLYGRVGMHPVEQFVYYVKQVELPEPAGP